MPKRDETLLDVSLEVTKWFDLNACLRGRAEPIWEFAHPGFAKIRKAVKDRGHATTVEKFWMSALALPVMPGGGLDFGRAEIGGIDEPHAVADSAVVKEIKYGKSPMPKLLVHASFGLPLRLSGGDAPDDDILMSLAAYAALYVPTLDAYCHTDDYEELGGTVRDGTEIDPAGLERLKQAVARRGAKAKPRKRR